MGSGASNMFSKNPIIRNVLTEDIPAFKIVIVGDSNVGKSSFFLRFTREQFDYSYQPTMNVNIGNVTKKVQTPFETLVSLTIWDIPGREEIDLRRSYYKDIDAAIGIDVIVDLNDHGSIEMAGTWKQDILNNAMYSEQPLNSLSTSTGPTLNSGEKLRKKSMKSQLQLPILLVGNKFDKISQNENDEGFGALKEIRALEETAVQHGFVGCVVVSSRENDGGVHGAMKSLVRYLLQKKLPKKAKQGAYQKTKLRDIFNDPNQHSIFARNLTNADDHHYESLKMCTITEFDKIFQECDNQIKQVEICCIGFMIAVKNFKRACCISGVTDTYKASIEECITGLKDSLRNGEDDILLAVEDAGFIKLDVSVDKSKIPGSIKRVLEIYENEVCKQSRRVLSLCPTLKINLVDYLTTLTSLEDSINEKAIESNLNKKQQKQLSFTFTENKTRIKDTIDLANESMTATDEQYKKIKNAMMW